MSISGSQFIVPKSDITYTVSDIPDGYTLDMLILPEGWTSVSTGSITEGSQAFVVMANNNSGTIIVNYTGAAKPLSVSIDVSVNATSKGDATQTTVIGIFNSIKIANAGLTVGFKKFPPLNQAAICPQPDTGCPYTLPVFADINDPNNALHNDKSDFYYSGDTSVKGISMFLQKSNGCGGAWATVMSFNGGTAGTNGTPGQQASLFCPIVSWGGSEYISGTFTIGSVILALSFTGTYADYLIYLAGLINANGNYTATVQVNGITIYGQNYALDNGTPVTQTINNNAYTFKAQATATDAGGTASVTNPVVVTDNPQKFSNVILNLGGVYDGTSTYTSPGTDTVIFSGVMTFVGNADYPPDFNSAGITIELRVNTGSGYTTVQTLNAGTRNVGALQTYVFSFAAVVLASGNQVQLKVTGTTRFTASHPDSEGEIYIAQQDSYWQNSITSSSPTVTDWGNLANGINPISGTAGTSGSPGYFSFGTAPDLSNNPFTDDYGNQYTGVLLNWLTILKSYGVGEYRMQIVYTYTDGTTSTIYDNRLFCLQQYNCNAIDGTVRIEYWNIGVRGTLSNPDSYIDYGSANLPLSNGTTMAASYPGWYSQIRIEAIFFSVKYGYTKEFNQMGDDEYNAFKPIILEQTPKFTLEVSPAEGWMDWYLSTNVAQADTILMTDYNVCNRHSFIEFPVIIDGEIAPKDDNFINPLAIIRVPFAYGNNNLRRRND